jgi:TonB-dependent receptor
MNFTAGHVSCLSSKFIQLRLSLLLAVLVPLTLFSQPAAGQARRSTSGSGPANAATDQNGKGSITGYVTDAAGGVLQGAVVSVQPGGFSTISDNQGQFTISSLQPGEYTIEVTYSGFATFTTRMKLAANQQSTIAVQLKVAASSQSVEVHADLEGEAEQIQIQKTSPDIVNVLSSDVITSLPNANIADAVGRLPGVTLERDEGEGKYVQVRGTEPRLTNVTIEGINVPSPEVGVRQIKLDVIPADLVEAVVLQKTLSASQDGDAIGGTVDLKLKNAGDQPTLILGAMGGYTPILGGRYIGQTTATVGQRFGTNKQFGALIGFTYDYNGRGIDDIEPAIDSTSAVPNYTSIDLREYRYQRTRWGIAGGADDRISKDSDIYLHYFYANFKDYGNKWVYTLTNDGMCAPTPGPQNLPTCNDSFTTSQRTPNYSIGSISGGGKHEFSSSWLAWDVSVSNGRMLQAAGNPGVSFGYTGSANCFYDPTVTKTAYRPQFNSACTAPGSGIFDPTQYSMTEFDTSTGPTDQVSLQGSVTYGKRYKWGSHDGTLQFGAKIRNSHNYENANSPIWDPNGNFLMSQFLSGFHNSNYYDGSYPPYGPVTSIGKLNTFFNNNPGDFTLDVSDTHLSNDPNNYNLTERVTAGYIMNTLKFGRWSLQTGLRLEATQLDIQGFTVLTVPLGQPNAGDWLSTNPVRTNQWYINPLPSLQLRYQLTANSDVRAVYGRGLSRPNPFDLVPYSTVDQSTNPFNIAVGNPNLKAERANDFDILFEHYLQPYGVIQAGFFYKQLIDPIYYTSQLDVTNPLCGPAPATTCPTTSIINGSNAHVGGVELAYLQHFGRLPGALSGFGIAANYTYTYSQAHGLPGRTDSPALQRQAPNSFNIGPSYDYQRLSIHVGMTYNSAMIYQYQFMPSTDPSNLGLKGPAGDIYLYSHFQLDAQVNVRLNHGLNMIVQGENLNNEVFGFYTGSKIYVDQREYYHPTYSLGLRWTPLREK